MSILGTLA